MYFMGLSRIAPMPATSACASSPPNFERQAPPDRARRAISSTTMNPMLWRLPAYSGPGVPRPTMSHMATPFVAQAVLLFALLLFWFSRRCWCRRRGRRRRRARRTRGRARRTRSRARCTRSRTWNRRRTLGRRCFGGRCFFLLRLRRHHRRDGRAGIDQRPHSLGEFQIADVHGVANLELLDIDRELVRNGGRLGGDLERTIDDVEQASDFDSLGLAEELNRHGDPHFFVHPDLNEIRVLELVAERMQLIVAQHHGQLGLAVPSGDLHRNQRVLAFLRIERLHERLWIERNRNRLGASPVTNPRDFARCAQPARDALAGLGSILDVELPNRHDFLPT